MKQFKKLSWAGIVVVALLVFVGLLCLSAKAPMASIAGVSMLPFAFGAIKVRDDMRLIRTVKYTHSGATVKDTIYLLNSKAMLAVNSADANVENVFVVAGLIEYAAATSQAWTGGVNLYWDDSAKKFTTAGTGNTLSGIAAEAKDAAATTGFIILMPMLTGTSALENAIADPGDGEAIPVTASGVVAMTSAGSETRTLADPTVIGQQLALIDDTHTSGSIVVTAASAINQTGNTVMTFGAVKDMIVLTAMSVGGALVWRVTANDGCSLSTP